MDTVLIAGAGAEVDLGFPAGVSFTRSTFYCKKPKLYDALRQFYKGRLGNSEKGLLPVSYVPAFLFNSNGAAFKLLIDNISKDNPELIQNILDAALMPGDYEKLSTEQLALLYNKFIIENDSSDEINKLNAISSSIAKDVHFGVLEKYYSELLHPNEHPHRFWKLINFYWSAFFSIILPITDRLYIDMPEYNIDRYRYVLNDLNEVIHRVFDEIEVQKWIPDNSYYAKLQGKIDGLITTNYTPYASSVVGFNDDANAWLAGRLSQFERLDTLEHSDYSHKNDNVADSEFVFPYLMCQSPVKPIISASQIKEYAKAREMLFSAHRIIVLGYSFCDEDAHIASMVGSALRNDRNKELVFLKYWDQEGSQAKPCSKDVENELRRQLRCSNVQNTCSISIRFIKSCESPEFSSLLDELPIKDE